MAQITNRIQHAMAQTPSSGETFFRELPIYLENVANRRTVPVASNSANKFVNGNGNVAIGEMAFGFNYNGELLSGPVVLNVATGLASGTKLYVGADGSLTGNPFANNAKPKGIQCAGWVIDATHIYLDLQSNVAVK